MTMVRHPVDGRGRGALDDDVDLGRDRDLVLRAQEGDRAAFDDLYARYYSRLWRFCRKRLGDDHEAEDVTQEAFMRAWRALPGFSGDRRFYPWLSVIAAHLCSNTLRKGKRLDPVGEFSDRHLASCEDSGEDRLMAKCDSEAVARAYAELSTRHRMVLNLREHRGWSYQQIAEHEGVRVSTVESLLWRARTALKREYSAQDAAGGMAGFAGMFVALRRWGRAAQSAARQGAGIAPAPSSMAVGSASALSSAFAAVTSVVAVMGAIATSGSGTSAALSQAHTPGVVSSSLAGGSPVEPAPRHVSSVGPADGAAVAGPELGQGPAVPGLGSATAPGPTFVSPPPAPSMASAPSATVVTNGSLSPVVAIVSSGTTTQAIAVTGP